jgi:hypothetical protein
LCHQNDEVIFEWRKRRREEKRRMTKRDQKRKIVSKERTLISTKRHASVHEIREVVGMAVLIGVPGYWNKLVNNVYDNIKER